MTADRDPRRIEIPSSSPPKYLIINAGHMGKLREGAPNLASLLDIASASFANSSQITITPGEVYVPIGEIIGAFQARRKELNDKDLFREELMEYVAWQRSELKLFDPHTLLSDSRDIFAEATKQLPRNVAMIKSLITMRSVLNIALNNYDAALHLVEACRLNDIPITVDDFEKDGEFRLLTQAEIDDIARGKEELDMEAEPLIEQQETMAIERRDLKDS